MFLKEFEGAELLKASVINVPRSVVIVGDDFKKRDNVKKKVDTFMDDNAELQSFVLKAQLLKGHRGKTGGIVFCDSDTIIDELFKLKGKKFEGNFPDEILVAEKLQVKKEMYLSVTIDNSARSPMLVFSPEGGIDIEEISAKHPEKIFKLTLSGENTEDEASIKGFYSTACKNDNALIERFAGITKKIVALMKKSDALLVEVNPIILGADGALYAADAKIIIDDNALFRHPEFAPQKNRGKSDLEMEAAGAGLSYVELDGDLAIIGNGAGLVMATLDAVKQRGGRPANFCDVGGGADKDMMARAIDIVLRKDSVKGLLINIFGGITHCDEIANGIREFFGKTEKKIPIIARITGTNETVARDILNDLNIEAFIEFDDAVLKASQLN